MPRHCNSPAPLFSRWVRWLCVLMGLVSISAPARADRLLDMCHVVGVRDNQLVGYGVVTGLDGTGDDFTAPFAMQSLRALLRRLGVQIDSNQLRLRNVAAVIVTADLPPFARQGARIDITVASIGNARSLRGGVLVQTPLRGADRRTYAVAQGSVVVGGYNAFGQTGSQLRTGMTNAGRIPSGALVEREVRMAMSDKEGAITLALHNPNFVTAARITTALNDKFGKDTAAAVDAGAIKLKTPKDYDKQQVAFLAALHELDITPEIAAKVVINERTGTVVAGGDVRLLPVAIAQGGITISVSETPQIVQPNAFGDGQTAQLEQSEVSAQESVPAMSYVAGAATLAEVAQALSTFGVPPRELASILQALKAAGALRAEIQVQ
jgi:flagellar P-ring protein precursor FlgI